MLKVVGQNKMVLDFDHGRVDRLIEWAKANIIIEKEIYNIKSGRSEYPKESHLRTKNFDLWCTVEEQPLAGLCYHITLAKTIPLTIYENYQIIEELINLFFIEREDVLTIEFEGPKMHIFVRFHK